MIRPLPWSHLVGLSCLISGIEAYGFTLALQAANYLATMIPVVASVGFLALAVAVWRIRRVEIDAMSVRRCEFRSDVIELSRGDVSGVERAGSQWRVYTRTGKEFWLSMGWSRRRVERIVAELGLPAPTVLRVGRVQWVLRDWIGMAIRSALVLGIVGLLALIELARGVRGRTLLVLPAMVVVLLVVLTAQTYYYGIVIGEEGIRARVEGIGAVVVSRSAVVSVAHYGERGYINDDAGRQLYLGKSSGYDVLMLGGLLGVPVIEEDSSPVKSE